MALTLWCLSAAWVAMTAAAQAPSVGAAHIVDRVDRLLRGDSCEGEMIMSVVTRRWTCSLTMRVWSEGTEKALIKVTAPPKGGGLLEGQLLVAMPDMPDPRFAGTVIFLIKHDATGAQGFVVNRPVGDVPLRALMAQAGLKGGGGGTVRLHAGGPLETLGVFALHTADWSGAGTTPVKGGFAVTAEPAILHAIATGGGPRRVVLLLGYAGWAPGQLEAEMKAGAWVRATAEESLLFDPEPEGKWDRAMARRKIDL